MIGSDQKYSLQLYKELSLPNIQHPMNPLPHNSYSDELPLQNLQLSLPIHCSSQKQLTFVQQMVSCLQTSPYFEPNVWLVTHSEHSTNSNSQNSCCDQIFIKYSVVLVVRKQEVWSGKQMEYFKQKCDMVHNGIETLKGRYALENKMKYWIKRFNQSLSKQQALETSFILGSQFFKKMTKPLVNLSKSDADPIHLRT